MNNPFSYTHTKETVRTHVIMPEDVVRQLDKMVGMRERSKFIVDAVIERINRIKLRESASKLAGSLSDKNIEGWDTEENTSSWVQSLRKEADKKT